MHSEGFSFYFEGLQVDLCSLDAACMFAIFGNFSQPSAARPCADPMAVPMGSAAKVFQSLKRRAMLFGRRGTSCGHIVRQVQYFCKVFRRWVAFSRRVQDFGDLHRHFAWQAQHFRRVVLCVLWESDCPGCDKWWQRANCVACMGHRESIRLRGRKSFLESCWILPSRFYCHNLMPFGFWMDVFSLCFSLNSPAF